ncbi:uncharacterized protein LOC109828466 isoform X2 [Asparagus officinalis]|uniref:uncharacterized protein LOC109828466 isoform X2 n=1 Tax=Asparagus officinalis TaxID=4686 RepID=UPI00098E3CEE|nr:uncharacterized protein LOC109828466 isoform X2 [Asparagus officinalis]
MLEISMSKIRNLGEEVILVNDRFSPLRAICGESRTNLNNINNNTKGVIYHVDVRYVLIYGIMKELQERLNCFQQMDEWHQNYLRGWTNLCFTCLLLVKKLW